MKFLFIIIIVFLTSCTSSKFYIVRHAEKASQPANDPPLTEVGKQRAENLKTLLQSEQFTEMYSTNTLRTRSTAQPLAQQQNKTILLYQATPADSMRLFIEKLKTFRNKTVLVVGHSNTVRYVINGLYEKDTLKEHLGDAEYDNLFVVQRRRGLFGKTSYVRKKF